MHIAGPEQWLNQMSEGLACPGAPMISRGHWFSRMQLFKFASIFAGEIECWADTMQLVYDEDVGDSHNAPGIEIRVPGWGDVHTIEYIDPSITAWVLGNAGTYMATFIHGKYTQHVCSREKRKNSQLHSPLTILCIT